MARSSRRALLALSLLSLISAVWSEPSQPLDVLRRHEGEHDHHRIPVVATASSGPSEMHHSARPTATAAAHAHHHGDAPKYQLDADLIATEESYWDYDSTPEGHGGLMTAHIALMTLAWAGFLPLGIMLRAVHHPLFFPLQFLFIGTNVLAVFVARIYNGLTPNRYTHDSHSRMGYFFLVYAALVMSVDLIRAVRSLATWFRSGRSSENLAQALLGQTAVEKDDYEPLQEEVPDEEGEWSNGNLSRFTQYRRNTSESTHSDDTLHDNEGNVSFRPGSVSPSSSKPREELPEVIDLRPKPSTLQVVLKYLHIFSIRLLVFFGWCSLMTGIVVYTGTCKATFVNGCLAHYIKGSIFVWYGVITFGRYLGAFSELGWAWNKKPASGWRSRVPSPEMVEVGHILFYGTTQTFMERFGVPAGTPFSIHELEHISIAIMFFGTGLLGVLLELKSLRRLISTKARVSLAENKATATHGWSWNFAPALTIAITGLVMSKHHQEYAFAIDVHALWGNLLFMFGVFRMMTYAFLWLRPPTVSALPSRPPTEALASFCLIAGGILFICSSEEIVFAAMRADVADVMLFLNLTTTATTLFMAWIVALLAIKGFAYKRMQNAIQRAARPLNLA